MLSLLLVEPKVFLCLRNETIHFLNKVIFCKTYETRGLARERQIHVAFQLGQVSGFNIQKSIEA
jgi:hypothetical protein